MPVEIPESFHQIGFAVVERVLPEETRLDLIDEFEKLRGDSGSHSLRNIHVSPLVRTVAEGSTARDIAAQILGPTAKLVRAIFFDKVKGANWSVPWHQDLTIAVKEKSPLDGYGPWSVKDGVVHVQPPQSVLEAMVTVRLHLDDCFDDNGPVRVKSGSHLHGKIPEAKMEKWEGQEVGCIGSAGSALVMRPLLLHASSPATSPSHRRVLHLEYAAVDLASPLRWHLE